MMDGAPIETHADQKERERRQRQRSWAIAGALLAMSLLFYAATIVRMGAALKTPL